MKHETMLISVHTVVVSGITKNTFNNFKSLAKGSTQYQLIEDRGLFAFASLEDAEEFVKSVNAI